MKTMLLIVLLAVTANGADSVNWTRFRGKVKHVDLKASRVMIQNDEGDLVDIRIDNDVTIQSGKEIKLLREVAYGDKVTLLNAPKAPETKESEEPAAGGVYPPAKR